MAKKVLDVGQCNPDHSSISTVLSQNFDVDVVRAHSYDQAIELAGETSFDLILINRILDADGTEGMKILKALKEASASSEVPVMIVSNYEDAQAAAIKSGAVPGFGKSSLNSPATLDLLKQHLG